jgi:hypothetical protein
VDLTESGLRVLVGIEFCATGHRIFREIQASNFACACGWELARGCVFLVLIREGVARGGGRTTTPMGRLSR